MKGKGASVSVVMAWDVIYGLGRHYLLFAFAFDDIRYIHGTLDFKIGVLMTEKPRLRTLYYRLLRLSHSLFSLFVFDVSNKCLDPAPAGASTYFTQRTNQLLKQSSFSQEKGHTTL